MLDQHHKIHLILILEYLPGMTPVCNGPYADAKILLFSQALPLIIYYGSLIDPAGISAFPVCGTLGFTEVPGDNEIGVWPPPPVPRHVCISSCRRNKTCKAVSYAKQYKLCSYYSDYMKNDHLNEDESSNFEHYDEDCRVEAH